MKKTLLTICCILATSFWTAVKADTVSDTLDLARRGATSVGSLLAGRVSGLDVTSVTGSAVGSVNTLIRGLNSLKTDSQPLWIVDGAYLNPTTDVDNPFWEYGSQTYTAPQSSLMGINLQDIESIEVLKDISATALYGSGGAGGVIIIRTRYPKSNLPVGVTVNSEASTDGSHRHTVSLGGFRNNTSYYISGFYRSDESGESSSQYGGFRFNFRSEASAKVQMGLSGMVSLGHHEALNPMLDASSDIDDNSDEFRTTDSYFVTLKPFRGFTLKGEAGVDFRTKDRLMWYGQTTEFGALTEGALSVSSISLFQYNAGVSAAWQRFFGRHHLNLSATADLLSGNPSYTVMCGYQFFDTTLRSKGMVVAGNTSRNRRNVWDWTRQGFSAVAEYDFDGKAGFNLTWRSDKDTTFEQDYTAYPAAQAWIDLSGALGLKPSSLRLTAGWGKAGQSSHVPYQWMDKYTQQCPEIELDYQPFYKGFLKAVSTEANAGVEASLPAGRLDIAVKYYLKRTDETLSFLCNGEEYNSRGTWRYCDYYEIYSESDRVASEGIEFDIDAVPVRRGGFCWTIGIHGAFNDNKVQSIPYVGNEVDAVTHRWTESDVAGYSPHQIVGYGLSGDGSIIDRTADGKITPADMTCLASTLPYFTGGLTTTLSAGRFSLDATAGVRLGANYLDVAALLAADTSGSQALVTSAYIVSSDRFFPGRATLAYRLPLGRFEDMVGLKLSLTAARSLPVSGYSAFPERTSCVGGICLTF